MHIYIKFYMQKYNIYSSYNTEYSIEAHVKALMKMDDVIKIEFSKKSCTELAVADWPSKVSLNLKVKFSEVGEAFQLSIPYCPPYDHSNEHQQYHTY